MILGLSTTTFTSVHVALSLIGIVSGVIVLYVMVRATRLDGWTTLFLAATERGRSPKVYFSLPDVDGALSELEYSPRTSPPSSTAMTA
jgi:hypothetical protein